MQSPPQLSSEHKRQAELLSSAAGLSNLSERLALCTRIDVTGLLT